MSRASPRNKRRLVPSLPLAAAASLALAGCSSGGADPAQVGCVPACAAVVCGSPDGCGSTCPAGSGCSVVAGPGARIEGGVSLGAAHAVGPSHEVQGGLSHGATPEPLRSAAYRIEQGTLR